MSNELKPCPFCNGEPEFWDGKGAQAYLECGDCGQATVGVQLTDVMTYEERYAPENYFNYETLSYPQWVIDKAKNEMTDLWNTRADLAIPEGYVLMPIEPSDEIWDGLARAMIMGRDLGCYRTDEMRNHLESSGYKIQEWLDLELSGIRHLSKGDMCVLIYKAMLAARPKIGGNND